MSNAAPRKAAVRFIFITVLLDMLGIGIVIPVLPQLVTELVGGDPSAGARWYGPIVSLYAGMQFVFAPLLGALSDRYGRRPVILISLLGFGLNYIILGLAPSLLWLIVGRTFAGVTGATVTAANAYLADISTPADRAKNFGLMGAAFGLGFILGPATGGLLGEIGLRVPFFVSAGVVLLNALYGYFVLPESLPPESRTATIDLRGANPLKSLGRLRAHPLVGKLAVVFVLAALAQRGLESVWVLHATERYGWSQLENGMTLALVGVMTAIVQGGLIRKVVPALGERKTILLGLGGAALAQVGFGLASEGWMALAVIPVTAMGALAMPTLQGVVAGSVDATEQGRIQGALTSILSLTAIVAPLVSTWLFAYFTSDAAPIELPGAPFFTGALFMALALAVAAWALPKGEGKTVGAAPPVH